MKEASIRDTVLKYRPDIDGLRGVAVLSVLAFHMWPWRVSGGFIGVDVFFVISGYLISAIVFSEVASGRFSVLAFYERRIRRIFPALFAMLVAFSAVVSFLLVPNELIDYAKSVIAATTSSSNFYFWLHSGYFDAPMSKPLLHTWSLAVEEQFYILFPLFLLTGRRLFGFGQRLRYSVVILLFVSLFASIATLHYRPTTAFYMPYTRAWELLVGTAIALGFFPRLHLAWVRNGIALLGIAMICFSVFRYSPTTSFPGLAAVVPCIGSGLIIAAGESGSSLVSKALSLRPIVFIGLISYSLYLWHWPVLVLSDLGLWPNFSALIPQRWAFPILLQKSNRPMLVLLAFGLAVLSWRFVERPFRSHPRRVGRQPLFGLAGAVAAVLLLFSGAAIHTSGFPRRFPDRAVQVASFRLPPDSMIGQLGDCVITESNQTTVFFERDGNCLHSDPSNETYLLLGDSHAYSLWEGLKTSLPNSNILLAAAWGCSASIHRDAYREHLGEMRPLCGDMASFIFQKYLSTHTIRALLVNYRWKSRDLNGVDEIVAWAKAHGVTSIIFGPVAEYDAPLPRLLAYSIAWNKPNLPQHHRLPDSSIMDAQMANLAGSRWHVPYVSLYQATCQRDRCLEYADEQNEIPLLKDQDHLTEDGSRFLARRVSRLGELNVLNDKVSSE